MTLAPLSFAQVCRLAADAGFSGDGFRTIVAIAHAESGFVPDQTNTAGNTPPSEDRGILQINNYWHKEVTDAQAFDPAWSFRWAFTASKQGTDFSQWATYTGGAYKQYLPTQLQLAGVIAMSEFVGGHNDDCGPDAELIALAVEKAEGLTATELTLIRSRDIAKGWFTAGGGEPLSSILADLKTFEPAAQILAYVPYQAWAGDDAHAEQVHAALKQWAGIQPVIIQVLNAQALPGNESGVRSHFVMVGGIDDALGYLVLNGDDVRALNPTYLATYPGRWATWAQLVAAQIAGCIVIKVPEQAPAGSNPVIVIERDASGTVTGAHDDTNGHRVNSGFAAYIDQHQLTAATLAVGETPTNGGAQSFAVLRGAARLVLTWSQTGGVASYGGDIVPILQAEATQPPVVTTVTQTVPVVVVTAGGGLTAAQDAAVAADLDDIALRIGLVAHS